MKKIISVLTVVAMLFTTLSGINIVAYANDIVITVNGEASDYISVSEEEGQIIYNGDLYPVRWEVTYTDGEKHIEDDEGYLYKGEDGAKLWYDDYYAEVNLVARESVGKTEDISSVEFYARRPLIAGLNEHFTKALGAIVNFKDGSTFDCDLGYSYSSYMSSDKRDIEDYIHSLIQDNYYDTSEFLNNIGKYTFNIETDNESSINIINNSVVIEVVENPVSSIEVLDEMPLTVYDVESSVEEYWDEESGEYKSYNVFDPERVSLLITYKDGTKLTLDVNDGPYLKSHSGYGYDGRSASDFLNMRFIDDDTIDDDAEVHNEYRHQVTYYSNQLEQPWTVGNTYSVEVELLGAKTQYSVKVLEAKLHERVDLNLDEPFTMNWYEAERTVNEGETQYKFDDLYFTPSEDGEYNFEYSGRVELYDGDELVFDEYGWSTAELTEGKTYKVRWTFYNDDATICVKKQDSGDDSDEKNYIDAGEVNVGDAKDIEINSSDYLRYSFTPSESGVYHLYSTGESDPYVRIYNDEDSVASDDDSGANYNFDLYYAFEAGKEYLIDIGAYSSGSCTIHLEESNIKGVTVNVSDNELVEDVDVENVYGYDSYVLPLFRDGSSITFDYTDGTSNVYNYSWDSGSFIDDSGNELNFDYHATSDQSEENKWAIGDHSFTLNIFGFEIEVPVKVVENQIASISFVPVKKPESILNIDGHYNSDEEYFSQSFDFYEEGNQLTVNYKDGTSTTYTCECKEDDEYTFYDSNGNELPMGLDFETDQSYDNQWGIGEHTAIVKYGGRSTEVTVCVVECDYDLEIDGGFLELDQSASVELKKAQTCTFSFTPETSGNYSFSSSGSYDTKGSIYSGDTLIKENDDDYDGSNFNVIAHLEAGTEYTLKCQFYYTDTEGEFSIIIENYSGDISDNLSATDVLSSLVKQEAINRGENRNLVLEPGTGVSIQLPENAENAQLLFKGLEKDNLIDAFVFPHDGLYDDWSGESYEDLKGYSYYQGAIQNESTIDISNLYDNYVVLYNTSDSETADFNLTVMSDLSATDVLSSLVKQEPINLGENRNLVLEPGTGVSIQLPENAENAQLLFKGLETDNLIDAFVFPHDGLYDDWSGESYEDLKGYSYYQGAIQNESTIDISNLYDNYVVLYNTSDSETADFNLIASEGNILSFEFIPKYTVKVLCDYGMPYYWVGLFAKDNTIIVNTASGEERYVCKYVEELDDYAFVDENNSCVISRDNEDFYGTFDIESGNEIVTVHYNGYTAELPAKVEAWDGFSHETLLNGVETNLISNTSFYSTDITFTYDGEEEIDKWEFGDAIEGYDYHLVSTDDNSVTIRLMQTTQSITVNAITDGSSIEPIDEDSVADMINSLPVADAVTTADKDAIVAAREAYNALTAEQKAKVSAETLAKLTEAEEALAAAEAAEQEAAEKEAADQAAADEATAKINALSAEVTTADEEAIKAAREAYDALTEDQKAKVSEDTIKKLTDAETALAAAEAAEQEAAEKEAADQAAAEAAEAIIDEIPAAEAVSTADKEKITAARAAYNALTDKQKALVSKEELAKLTEAEEALVAAEAAEQEAAEKEAADQAAADEATAKIDALPAEVTTADEEAIKAAREAYEALTEDQKAKLNPEIIEKIEKAEAALEEAKKAAEQSEKPSDSQTSPSSPTQKADTIKPNNAANNSNAYQIIAGEAIDAKMPLAKLKKLKKGKKRFTAKWKALSGVDGYQIQYGLKKNFKKAKKKTVKGAKKTKVTIKKLKSKKKYFVRIRTYKVINGKKVYSKWSKAKKVKVK